MIIFLEKKTNPLFCGLQVITIALIIISSSSTFADEQFTYSKDIGFFTMLVMNDEVPPVTEKAVFNSCTGGCHMAYPAGILPVRSWKLIFKSLDNHYGDKINLKNDLTEKLAGYYFKNAAEFTESTVSVKILDSLSESETPLRLMDIPYLTRKHRKLEYVLYESPSVKFMGNCIACHIDVEKTGDFDEGSVEIPK